MGVISYIVFHVFFNLNPLKEEKPKANGHVIESGENEPLKMTAKSKIMHFLQMPLLYQTSLL